MKKTKEDVDGRQQGGGRLGEAQGMFLERLWFGLLLQPPCVIRRRSAESETHLHETSGGFCDSPFVSFKNLSFSLSEHSCDDPKGE